MPVATKQGPLTAMGSEGHTPQGLDMILGSHQPWAQGTPGGCIGRVPCTPGQRGIGDAPLTPTPQKAVGVGLQGISPHASHPTCQLPAINLMVTNPLSERPKGVPLRRF